jgi:hypothetical protein
MGVGREVVVEAAEGVGKEVLAAVPLERAEAVEGAECVAARVPAVVRVGAEDGVWREERAADVEGFKDWEDRRLGPEDIEGTRE